MPENLIDATITDTVALAWNGRSPGALLEVANPLEALTPDELRSLADAAVRIAERIEFELPSQVPPPPGVPKAQWVDVPAERKATVTRLYGGGRS